MTNDSNNDDDVRETPNVPALSARDRVRQDIANQASKMGAPSGDKIHFSKGKFKTPDGNEGISFEVVIIDFVSARDYYKDLYDPKNIVPPDCFARCASPKNMVPSDKSPDMQATACAPCPMNQFKSGPRGSKACKETRLLGVVPLDSDDGMPIWVFSVPVMSTKFFEGYAAGLAREGESMMEYTTIVTQAEDQEYHSPRFAKGRPVDDEELEALVKLRDDVIKRLMTEPDVERLAAAPPAPAAKGRASPARR